MGTHFRYGLSLQTNNGTAHRLEFWYFLHQTTKVLLPGRSAGPPLLLNMDQFITF